MRLTFTMISIAVALLVSSCSRSLVDRKPNSTLKGIWSFKYSTAHIYSSVIDSAANFNYMGDTTFNYTTVSGYGAVAITADSIFSTGLFYNVADTIFIGEYANKAMVRLDKSPISYSVNIDNLNMPIVLVGSDSMYFPLGATLKQPTNLGIPDPIIFSGAKYTLSGNTLTLTCIARVDAIYPYDTGLPDTPTYHQYAVITTTFYQ